LLVWALFALTGCSPTPYTFHGTPFDPIMDAPEIVGLRAGNIDFKLSDLPEKVKLIFFGYTFCPDVCPLTMANLRAAYDKLSSSEKQQVAIIMVSVDPERDTPDRLGTYVNAFDPAFYGVHVPLANLSDVKKGYGVYSEKRYLDAKVSAADYLIDHSAILYVVDKDDKLREIFPTDAPPEDVADDVKHLLQ
jgi:protein SCO1/2